MNLNFYPTDFNQPNINPYLNMLGVDTNKLMQNFQQTAESQLKQLQNQFVPQNQNTQQPYYILCGNKKDWDEFLWLNYKMTEKDIFDDYKLFLQAKQELLEEQGQNKINTMKDKIKNKDNMVTLDATVQSNIKPEKQLVQPNITIRDISSVDNGDISEPVNRQLESSKRQSRENTKQK